LSLSKSPGVSTSSTTGPAAVYKRTQRKSVALAFAFAAGAVALAALAVDLGVIRVGALDAARIVAADLQSL
jgi:hypothetical protein